MASTLMENVVVFLPVAIHPSVPLFHAVRVPRNLVMNKAMAVVLEVDALGRSVGGEKDADRRLGRVRLEGCFDFLAFVQG